MWFYNGKLVFMLITTLLFHVLDAYRLAFDRLCGLVVRALGYGSGGPGSNPSSTKKKVVCLERGPLSLVSTTDRNLIPDRNVTAPV
jgi:hypothetical protein